MIENLRTCNINRRSNKHSWSNCPSFSSCQRKHFIYLHFPLTDWTKPAWWTTSYHLLPQTYPLLSGRMVHDAKLIGHSFQRFKSTSSQSQSFSHFGNCTQGLSLFFLALESESSKNDAIILYDIYVPKRVDLFFPEGVVKCFEHLYVK